MDTTSNEDLQQMDNHNFLKTTSMLFFKKKKKKKNLFKMKLEKKIIKNFQTFIQQHD
jgi:hypothetical protein